MSTPAPPPETGWVFCCGMQRSGSTLQFQITAHLVEEAGLGRRVEWVAPERFSELLSASEATPRLRVLKAHVCTPAMAAELDAGRALGVCVFRDVRDVMVSAMRKYDMSFEELWRGRFIHGCLYQFARWARSPRVLVSRYEDVVADLPAEVGRIARHLGIECGPERCREIAAAYAPERQRARIAEAVRAGGLLEGKAGTRYDPYSQLHTDHLADGSAGAWRNRLTAVDVARIEHMAGGWLEAHGYPLRHGPVRRWLLCASGRAFRALRRGRTLRRDPVTPPRDAPGDVAR